MRRFHLATTATLALAVVVLIVLLRRNWPSEIPATMPVVKGPMVRKVERLSEFEHAMESLGYRAWGFRWNGGMIDPVIVCGPGGPIAMEGEGAALLTDLVNLGRGSGESPDSKSVSGELLVLLGPLADDSQSTEVPCRIAMAARLASRKEVRRVFQTNVQFAEAPAAQEMSVPVYGKWRIHDGGARSGDHASAYDLIRLRWINGDETL